MHTIAAQFTNLIRFCQAAIAAWARRAVPGGGWPV